MTFCPHCGNNLSPDGFMEKGDWAVSLERVYHKGRILPGITRAETAFLHTLLKAEMHKAPKAESLPVRAETIGNRLSDAKDKAGAARFFAKKLRRKLPEVPFETVHGLGYRWAA